MERSTGPGTAQVGLAATFGTVEMTDAQGTPTRHFGVDDSMTLSATLGLDRAIEVPLLGVVVMNEAGVHVYSDHWVLDPSTDDGDQREVRVTLDLPLASGSYSAQLGLASLAGDPLATPPPQTLFFVAGRDRVNGVSDLGGRLDISPSDTR